MIYWKKYIIFLINNLTNFDILKLFNFRKIKIKFPEYFDHLRKIMFSCHITSIYYRSPKFSSTNHDYHSNKARCWNSSVG